MKDDMAELIPSYLQHTNMLMVVVTDFEGKYIYVNPYFQEKFRFIAQNFINLDARVSAVHFNDILMLEQAVADCVSNSPTPAKVRMRKPSPDGNWYWTNWEFSVLHDHASKPLGIMAIGQDITETERLRQAQKEIAEKNHQLLIQNEALKEIAWLESHQMRRPLANILGLIDLIIDDFRVEYLNHLKTVAQELDKVIHQVVKKANNSDTSL